MSREYQDFRKKVLEELNVEMPGLGYRQKMKVISERWKQHKIVQVSILTPEEIVKRFVGVSTPSEGGIRSLKFTIDCEGESEFITYRYKDKNLLLLLLGSLFDIMPMGDRFLLGLVKRFVGLGSLFHGLYLSEEKRYDVLDLVNFYQRWDILFVLLTNAPSDYLNQFAPSKIGCTLGLLFTNMKSSKDLRMSILDVVQNAVLTGLDPNLELGDVICGASMHELYQTHDPIYKELHSKGGASISVLHESKFVRYTGIRDVGREYRLFINKLTPVPLSIDTSSLEMVGETVFSVFLRYAKHRRHRALCEKLIKEGKIHLTTIVTQDGITPTSYQTMIFKKQPGVIVNLIDYLVTNTPHHFYYVKTAGDPLGTLIGSIKTTWELMVLVKGGASKALLSILTQHLMIPLENFVRQLVGCYPLLETVTSLYSRVTPPQMCRRYLGESSTSRFSVFEKLLLEGRGLELLIDDLRKGTSTITGLTMRHLASDKYGDLRLIAREVVGLPPPMDDVKNNTFIFSDLEVTQELLNDPLMVFVSDDNFVFHRDEFLHLMSKKENPFNRRLLNEREISRLEYLQETFNEWWFLYNGIPDIPSLQTVNRFSKGTELKLIVKYIDEFIDQCPFFTYGDRLEAHYDKIYKIEYLQSAYMYLFTAPVVCIQGASADGFQALCLPFRAAPGDHHTVEEIGLYFSMMLTEAFSQPTPDVSEVMKKVFLCVYLILDCTRRYSSLEVFYGRVITLYFVISTFIKEIPTP
jgi:hypothetical protein